MNIHNIVIKLVDLGITVKKRNLHNESSDSLNTIKNNYRSVPDWYNVFGFYDSKYVTIGVHDHTLIAIDSSGYCTELADGFNIDWVVNAVVAMCKLNLDLFEQCKNPSSYDPDWLPLLVNFHFLKEKVVTSISYERV